MEIDYEPLITSEALKITGQGTAVLFRHNPPALRPLGPIQVLVELPDGDQFETTASVEAVRKVPPGEVLGMLFSDLEPADIPQGSSVRFKGS